jgi:uncharacterized protein (DUF1330 family)
MTPKPAYVVAENDVVDPVAYKDYALSVLDTLKPFGGVPVVRAGITESLEGAPPGRLVIIRFDDIDHARAWWNSDEYRAILPMRLKAAKARVYIAEALSPA